MAIQIKFTNNFVATLAAAISDADTVITLDAGSGAKLPNYGGGDYEYMTIGNVSNNLEIVKVTQRAGDILTITRAQDGTTAKAWNAGDQINSRPCAAAMNDALQVNVAKADVDSQVFTGTPAMPTGTIAVTQAAGNNTTRIATTAFVTNAIATAEAALEAYADAAVLAAGVFQAKQTASNNTAFDFTGIPAGAKRLTVMFSGLSTNGVSPIIIQLGVSGIPETADYYGAAHNSGAVNNHTNGFRIRASAAVATEEYHGAVTLTRFDDASSTWVISGSVALSLAANSWWIAGGKTLAGELDMLRITTVDGTAANKFDVGSVGVLVEM